jgi:hypothetical protein
MIPVFGRAKMIYALDRPATVSCPSPKCNASLLSLSLSSLKAVTNSTALTCATGFKISQHSVKEPLLELGKAGSMSPM